MENDLISRSALLKELDGVKEPSIETGGTVKAEPVLNLLIELTKCVVESIPAVDAVPVEKLGKWGKLFIPHKGCPRGHVGRWERIEDQCSEKPVYKCSECGQEVTADDRTYIEKRVKHCPNCGRKMTEG